MSMTFRKKWFHMKRHFKRNMSFLGRGFVAHYVAAGEPTVRVMEMSEAQAYSEPGSSIAYMAPAESTKDVYAAMGIACGMSMNGVTNVMAEGECIVYKEFGMTHLLVCLFYFITIRQLSTSSSFFFHQRTQFHDYCSKNLPEGFKICSDRYFRTCINKLQWKSCSFNQYIISGVKPQVEWQKGQFNVEFWYAVYCKASRCYDEFFEKMMRK